MRFHDVRHITLPLRLKVWFRIRIG